MLTGTNKYKQQCKVWHGLPITIPSPPFLYTVFLCHNYSIYVGGHMAWPRTLDRQHQVGGGVKGQV